MGPANILDRTWQAGHGHVRTDRHPARPAAEEVHRTWPSAIPTGAALRWLGFISLADKKTELYLDEVKLETLPPRM